MECEQCDRCYDFPAMLSTLATGGVLAVGASVDASLGERQLESDNSSPAWSGPHLAAAAHE
jgi:hypothetical protein